MPNGPVSPKKQNTEQNETDQEENDARQKEKDVEQIRAKGDRGRFTRYDEDMLEKLADRLRATDKFDIYETLSELVSTYFPGCVTRYHRQQKFVVQLLTIVSLKNPKHTPDQWHAHFNEVILPRINLGKVPKESAAKPNQASEESGGGYGGSNNEELAASSNRDSPSSKAKREVKIKPGPITSSPEPKKGPPTPSIHSPIRMVDVRSRPNGAPPYPTREDMAKPSTPRERRKTTSSSPSHRPATPTGKVASIAPSKLSLPMTTPSRAKIQTPANHTLRWRAEIYKNPVTEDGDVGPILPKSLSHLPLTNQKRKRDSGSSPELRKKSRGVQENTSTESESPPRSRLLSPELLGSDANHQTSSPPPSTPKKKKLSYAELSTQAIYDQMDDDPSMEFPEIEIPSAPPTPVQSTPRPQAQPKPFTPTKPTSPTPGFAPKPPLSPTKNDPDGILEMNSFLAYCQKEFNASEKQVIYAIERASGIKQLVELVLQSIADDKPLPAHVPGVWSEEDDKILMGADSREMKKLQERKGAAHMERRMEFLNLWNMA